ncbi:haloalkane dehalogenase [Mycobacterium lentiflavum]|uniref:Alpha/beta fold hydrolase n=1 Tax=Mycobacterium lentiflavum TaxID=141349 RepID=A0A0E4GY12_MYCLN|nr:alpha/beta fold hydrolase [Mycobacterium lentiflavum]MEE3066013.1 alpha/beta fold hydrolase [Actinomycetota bacterium]ULP44770.1 alpha/beta fold hydrolase [Mycobacterium lentiflavum]CQD13860.1 haloalkane dehalogenase [Mycobacterium lentiflavum]
MGTARTNRLLERYRSSGRSFTAGGIASFVLDAGPPDAPPVVCVHGVPSSAYLYRKVVPALAGTGLRGIAIDLPGLGFAERPIDADYTWTGLGRWLLTAIDELQLDRFHLVVHDIGGPIGFEVANAVPERVLSMTLLNTIIEVESFHRPWPMEPFAHRGIGEAWLASLRVPGAFLSIMRLVGVSRHVPAAEIACWVPLLFGDDGGRAFLKIMRGFELTAAKEKLYLDAVRDGPYPVQVVWGARDRMLPWRRWGIQAQRAAGATDSILLPAKHFLQEDKPQEIADAVERFVSRHR